MSFLFQDMIIISYDLSRFIHILCKMHFVRFLTLMHSGLDCCFRLLQKVKLAPSYNSIYLISAINRSHLSIGVRIDLSEIKVESIQSDSCTLSIFPTNDLILIATISWTIITRVNEHRHPYIASSVLQPYCGTPDTRSLTTE